VAHLFRLNASRWDAGGAGWIIGAVASFARGYRETCMSANGLAIFMKAP
jgi:hypothetical protein